MAEMDEYPPEGRFAWDMIRMSPEELNEMCDWAEAGDIERACAVVDRAEERLFGNAST